MKPVGKSCQDWRTCLKLPPKASKLNQGCQMVLVSNQKSQFGSILKGLRLENDIFYGHLEYLLSYGIFYDHLVHFVLIFSGFDIMYQEKSGNLV
jgi:hypothetical protein